MGVLLFVGLLLSFPLLYVTPVVTYHSINDHSPTHSYFNTVTPQVFAQQMDFLAKRGYRVLSMDEYVKGLNSGNNFCCKSVVITFDDGELDNYTTALPILEQRHFPAAFFVKAISHPEKNEMSSDQVKDAAARGITIGSHTSTHAYLPKCTSAQKEQEIVGSKKLLEAVLGSPVNYLAYPTGGYDDEVKQIARKAGYTAAFTTNRGPGRFNRDFWAIKRMRLKNSDTDLILWFKLSGFYNLFRETRGASRKEE
ncbi:MAG: polysaccharide deacetylase family protein [Candidatus Omnitrophica bacterium]|nr:polysaccharide deacetylase family protein [Candidatus Omnitrophota bacterium]